MSAYVDNLRKLGACISDQPILAAGHDLAPVRHPLGFAPLHQLVPLRTRSGQRRLFLDMTHEYEIVPAQGPTRGFDVRNVSYAYQLLDAEEREIVAYHWHPVGMSHITYPHFHLSSRYAAISPPATQEPVALAALHLPTGTIAFAAIVRLLIAEVGMAPRRPDWQQIVTAAGG